MSGVVFKVVCRQLGYDDVLGDESLYKSSGYWRFRRLYGGDAEGPVWLSKVYCYGNESKLSQCKIDSPGEILWCGHIEVLELICRPRNYTPGELGYTKISNQTLDI